LLGNLPVRDVNYRPDDFVGAGFIPHAMGEIVQMLDGAVRHQQPMLVIKVTSALPGALERVFDEAHILRVRSLQYQLGRWCRSGGIPVNPRRLVGPEYPLRACFHCDEASATEPLRI
jgi:hypothetical protein